MAVHNCKYCKTECGFGGENKHRDCVGYTPMTNADRIRAMSDEELAEYFVGIAYDVRNGIEYSERHDVWLEWLQQPAGEE